MIYCRETTDFFGPKASEHTDLLEEPLAIHVIPQCGLEIVEAIDGLASAIVASKHRPVWQRRNGSIDFDQLPTGIKVLFNKGDFDEEGYINLDRMHIFHPNTLYSFAAHQIKTGRSIYCRHIGQDCSTPTKPLKYLTTCAALAYRLAEGKNFDVRRHTYSNGNIPKVKVPECYGYEQEKTTNHLEKEFHPIWNKTRNLQKGGSLFSFFIAGVIFVSGMMTILALMVFLVRKSNYAKLFFRAIQ